MDDYKDGFKRSFYSFDGHGSIRGLTNTEGSVYEEYDYDSYGIMIGFRQAEGSGLENIDTQMLGVLSRNEFLFAGEQWDADMGMYYNRARYYDVENGRFNAFDDWEGTQGNNVTLNKYLYGNGNPVTYLDPSGNASLIGDALARVKFQATLGAVGARVFGVRSLNFAVNRLALVYISNAIKLDIAIAIGGSTLAVADFALSVVENATAPKLPRGYPPGEWMEEQFKANATDYRNVDDIRLGSDGKLQATSFKTREGNRGMDKLLEKIEDDAKAVSGLNKAKPVPAAKGRIPIIDIKDAHKGLIVGVREDTNYVRSSEFQRRVHAMAVRLRVTIQVFPIRGWRK